MPAKKIVVKSKPGSSIATVRVFGNSTTNTVPRTSLPSSVQKKLK